MQGRLAALLAVAALLAAGLAWHALRERTDEAPTFRLPAVGEGDGVLDLEAARGQVVVLDLMAVNCTTCRTVANEVLAPIWQESNGTGVLVWSIDVWAGELGESAEDLADLQRREGYGWPHALDDGTVAGRYPVEGLPQVLVINRTGTVVYHASAPAPITYGAVREAIEKARAETARAVGIPVVGLAGLAAAAGVAAVLSPCSVGLLPAYFGMLLRKRPRPGPVRGGLEATGGVVTVYGAIAILLVPFGEALRPWLTKLGLVMGAIFILLGFAILAGVDWSRVTAAVRRRLPAAGEGRHAYWAFGVGYALASFGCTGPVFLVLLIQAFGTGPATGLGVLGLYTAGVAVLLVLVALLAATGADGPLRRLAAGGAWVTRAVAVLWIAAGAYLLWYDLRAQGWA